MLLSPFKFCAVSFGVYDIILVIQTLFRSSFALFSKWRSYTLVLNSPSGEGKPSF